MRLRLKVGDRDEIKAIKVKGVNTNGTVIGDGGDGAQILLESGCLPIKVCRIVCALMPVVCKVMQALTMTDVESSSREL